MAKDAGLVVVLDLHGAPGSQNGLDNSGQRSNDTRPERFTSFSYYYILLPFHRFRRWGAHWFYDRENQDATTEILVQMSAYIDFLNKSGIDNVVALGILL